MGNQALAQIDLHRNFTGAKAYKNDVYLLPKHLDEKVAALHLPACGASLTKLTKEQADYINVGENGPFKGDTNKCTTQTSNSHSHDESCPRLPSTPDDSPP